MLFNAVGAVGRLQGRLTTLVDSLARPCSLNEPKLSTMGNQLLGSRNPAVYDLGDFQEVACFTRGYRIHRQPLRVLPELWCAHQAKQFL